MLGDQGIRMGRGVASMIRRRNADYLFDGVRDRLRRADLVFGNLETVLSDRDLEPRSLKSRRLRGPPEAAAALRQAGFGVLSVANNHLRDHGSGAFEDTVARLEENGIAPVGVAEPGRLCRPAVVALPGARIGFLAYDWTPGPEGERADPYLSPFGEAILSEVSSLRRSVELVVLSLHWGYEFMERPSPGQVGFARHAVKAGAGIVVGHHPHCLQGIERYREGVICYSLGDFVFDFWQGWLRRTALAEVRVSGGAVADVALFPARISRSFQPRLLPPGRARRKGEAEFARLAALIPSTPGSSSESYLASARARRRRLRWSVRANFLGNLWRYPPVFLGQALRQFLGGRKR